MIDVLEPGLYEGPIDPCRFHQWLRRGAVPSELAVMVYDLDPLPNDDVNPVGVWLDQPMPRLAG